MQTLRGSCSKAEPKKFARRRPLAGDGQNLISWRLSLPLLTNPVWCRSMHAISSYRGNSPTNKQTNTHTHNDKPTNAATDRTDYNPLRRS